MTGPQETLIPPWGLAVAGATGAVLANALVYPLDIVKTRLQVQVKPRTEVKQSSSQKPAQGSHPTDVPSGEQVSRDSQEHYTSTLHAIQCIVRDEGPLGLYAGFTGSLIGVASQNFAYFYWYSIVRTLYLTRLRLSSKSSSPSTAIELSLGAAAGALAQIFTIPIAVVTTRQQTQKRDERKSILATAAEVVESDDGWTGLWRGMKASLVLVVNPSITYGAYQRLREVLYPDRPSLRAHEAFFLGAMSKALATMVTQPLIVAKVGLQSRPPPARQGKPFKSFLEVMRFITVHEGSLGLFKGIGPQLMKGLLVQGFLMMTKERVELLFLVLYSYLRRLRTERLRRVAEVAAGQAQKVVPALPVLIK